MFILAYLNQSTSHLTLKIGPNVESCEVVYPSGESYWWHSACWQCREQQGLCWPSLRAAGSMQREQQGLCWPSLLANLKYSSLSRQQVWPGERKEIGSFFQDQRGRGRRADRKITLEQLKKIEDGNHGPKLEDLPLSWVSSPFWRLLPRDIGRWQ